MRNVVLRFVIVALVVTALGGLMFQLSRSIHLGDFSWSRLGVEIARTRKSQLLMGLVAVYLAYFIRSLRWRRFCRYMGTASVMDVFMPTLMGFASVFVLGRAGEPVRPLLLARRCRMPVSGMFGIYVLERITDTVATVVLAGLTLLLPVAAVSGGADWQSRIRTAGIALLGGIIVFALVIVYLRTRGASFVQANFERWRAAGGWRGFVATQIAEFGEGLQAFRSASDWWAAAGYTAIHWVVVIFLYFIVLHSFGGALAQLTFPGVMLLLVFTLLGSVVQLPGVGGGAQVAGFIVLTRIFHIDPEPAAAATVVTWLMAFAGVCLVGLPLLIHEGLSFGELRRLARAETQAETHGQHVPVPEDSGEQSGGTVAQ